MPGAFFELGFDGGIDVDVIALGLAAHAPEAHAQPRQRLAQAVTFEPGDGSLGLDRRIDFLHGAPVVAVGLAMDVPLRVQDARTLAESVFHVFGLERGLQRANAAARSRARAMRSSVGARRVAADRKSVV